MDVRELQISDWVYDVNHNHLRVIGIGCPFEGEDFSNVYLGVLNEDGTYRNNECNIESRLIEPIPLTAEILEKNGFWKGCYVGYFQHNSLNNLGIDIGKNVGLGYFLDNPILEVQYVHELQHALRLCGLTELADNFKIK